MVVNDAGIPVSFQILVFHTPHPLSQAVLPARVFLTFWSCSFLIGKIGKLLILNRVVVPLIN